MSLLKIAKGEHCETINKNNGYLLKIFLQMSYFELGQQAYILKSHFQFPQIKS